MRQVIPLTDIGSFSVVTFNSLVRKWTDLMKNNVCGKCNCSKYIFFANLCAMIKIECIRGYNM